jgi:hypothetical protein
MRHQASGSRMPVCHNPPPNSQHSSAADAPPLSASRRCGAATATRSTAEAAAGDPQQSLREKGW